MRRAPAPILMRRTSGVVSSVDLEGCAWVNGEGSIETMSTLVLNADYTPICLSPLSLMGWKDAFKVVYTGRANVVSSYPGLKLRSVNHTFDLPSVIALKRYQPIHRAEPVLTRRNLFLRDGYKCQYCGQRHSHADLTLDHILPKSKGGLTAWNNVTTACITCNQRKGAAVLKEIRPMGMRLKSNPKAPTIHELTLKRTSEGGSRLSLHPHWKTFCFFEESSRQESAPAVTLA